MLYAVLYMILQDVVTLNKKVQFQTIHSTNKHFELAQGELINNNARLATLLSSCSKCGSLTFNYKSPVCL